jgi:ABC-type dipeptide/oligopeptide/nickel transport system ATPase component
VSVGSLLLSSHISVDYPNRQGVLRDVSFEIYSGEILGLVGESGSGKSTIALALLQLLGLKGARIWGEILFEGEDLLKKPEKQLRTIRGRRMSIVLQSPLASLNPALCIGTQLREAWRAHAHGSKQECDSAIRAALRSARLPDEEDFLRRRPSQLSVGQGQRVNIAMAILHRPALLIADEATSALDSITQSEILNLFAQLNRELDMAVLYISHDLPSVAALCNRVAILHQGQILETGTTDAIFTSPKNPYTQNLLRAIPLLQLPVSESLVLHSGISSR